MPLLTVLLAAMTGCGKSSLPPRAEVEGRVTLDGKPVTVGTVMFVPAQSGPAAMGFLDAQGHYQLTTDPHRPGDGAVIGSHQVSVESRDGAEPGAVSKSLVPPQYANPQTSGLVFEVKVGQRNTIDIPLSSQPPAPR